MIHHFLHPHDNNNKKIRKNNCFLFTLHVSSSILERQRMWHIERGASAPQLCFGPCQMSGARKSPRGPSTKVVLKLGFSNKDIRMHCKGCNVGGFNRYGLVSNHWGEFLEVMFLRYGMNYGKLLSCVLIMKNN